MKPAVIIPYGTGIGDYVNMRPLAEAVLQAYGGWDVSILCPPHLAALIPEGVTPLRAAGGIRLWQRPERAGLPARLASHLPPPLLAGAALGAMHLAPALGSLLHRQGYETINLLELFVSRRPEARWTPGVWNPPPAHVIDLLAAGLEERGIPVPRRVPVLRTVPSGLPPRAVLLNPHAGSVLKEPPSSFWRELTARLHGVVPLHELVPPGASPVVPRSVPVQARDIYELVRLVAGFSVVVSPDTGVLHIAAAAGVRHVGLFGPTDARFLGPYIPDAIFSIRDHPPACRGCWAAQLLPAAPCLDTRPTCLVDLDAGRVAAAVLDRV